MPSPWPTETDRHVVPPASRDWRAVYLFAVAWLVAFVVVALSLFLLPPRE